MATVLIRPLRSAPVVMVQPAEHGNSLDARIHLRRASDGLLLSERLMRARVIVEARELDDEMSQVLRNPSVTCVLPGPTATSYAR